MDIKVKVRGIYSTGLIKYLLEKGYKVTQLSRKQQRRFGIKSKEEPDIIINDTPDRLGIIVKGEKRKVLRLLADFKEDFWDSIFLVSIKGVITKGKLIEKKENEALIETDYGVGVLPINEVEGEEMFVQIVEEEPLRFTTRIRLEGKYVIIIKGGFHNISNKIPQERQLELEKVLQEKAKPGFGIYFKPSSAKAKIEDIKKEIDALYEKFEKKEFEEKIVARVYFGYHSKRLIEEYRNKVIPTIRKHLEYRTSKTFNIIVDLAEKILEKDPNLRELVEETILEVNAEKIKERGTVIRMHLKPWNKSHQKIEAVKDIKIVENKFVLETIRPIKPGGTYDQLNLPIEPGDYAVCKYKEGEFYYEVYYYSKDGNLKFKYININTPIEIFGTRIRYFDLEIDVIEREGMKMVVESEKFEELFRKGIISSKLYNFIKELVEKL